MSKNILVICDNCKHKEVCQFQLEYRSACKALEEAYVTLPERIDGKTAMRRIHDFSWLTKVTIGCRYYYAIGPILGEQRGIR